jgi:hypothetical protein
MGQSTISMHLHRKFNTFFSTIKNTMKKVFAILTLLLPLLSFSQEVSISEESIAFNNGTYTAYVLKIPYAKFKNVQEEFAKSFREKTVSEIQQNGNEFYIPNVMIKEVMNDTFDMDCMIYQSDDYTTLAVRFIQDSVNLLETLPDMNRQAFKQILLDFANSVHVNALKERVEIEKELLSELENKEKKKVKQYDRRFKIKAKNQRNIEKLNIKIEENKTEVGLITKQIEGYKKTKITENPSESYLKDLNKKIKKLEKQKKKLLKDNEGLHRNINALQSENRTLAREIEKINSDLKFIQQQITEQDLLLKEFKEKLKESKRN